MACVCQWECLSLVFKPMTYVALVYHNIIEVLDHFTLVITCDMLMDHLSIPWIEHLFFFIFWQAYMAYWFMKMNWFYVRLAEVRKLAWLKMQLPSWLLEFMKCFISCDLSKISWKEKEFFQKVQGYISNKVLLD